MTAEAPALTPRRKWSILLVLSLALAIIIIDTTLLNVSLSTIINDLHTDIQSIQWVISGYSLTLAALTIAGGRLGDFFGRRRMFVIGAIIFAIGSFITSISNDVPTMIAGEAIIEGIGAALMMPATSSILVANFRGRDRAIGFGVWGAIAGASSAIGPILGGWMATNYSWRWGFRINVFVAAVLCLGALIIPESRDEQEAPRLDWVGLLLSSLGLVSFIFATIESSTYGWWAAKQDFVAWGQTISFGSLSIVPVAMALGIVLLGLFVLWEQRMDRKGLTPLVSMKMFANRQFSSGVLTTTILSLGMSGIIFSVPVFLQTVRGLDALHTGYSLLPLSLAVLVVAPLGAVLTGKVRPKTLIQIGLLCTVAAMFVLRSGFSVDATVWSMAPGLALYGIGMGLVMSQVNNLTMSAVSVQQAGEASGVNNTMRQVGSSLGAAIIGAVLLSALATSLGNGIRSSAVIPEPLREPIAQAASSQASNVEFGGARLGGNLPASITEEIVRIGHQATVDADKEAILYGALFAILGFVVSFWLPNDKIMDKGQSLAAGH